MDYSLFDEYITLQALLKDLGIIPNGGASKAYLAEHLVLYNGEKEQRRGKKLRIGDRVTLVDTALTITLVAPSKEEQQVREEELREKERLAKIVKQHQKKKLLQTKTKQPVRFPGT